MSQTLDTLDDIRAYFANNQTPYYFVSPTNFNLINMDKWVKNWTNINYIDCFDGQSPNVLVPSNIALEVFESVEQINHYLLRHPEVIARIQNDKMTLNANGRVMFLFFNDSLETLAAELGLSVQLPKHALVKDVDSKITTTQIGNAAGVMSVPNVLAKIDSYQTLLALAETHNLGTRWVIQSAYGDSGKTTYFIDNKDDYAAIAQEIESEAQVKVMKRINCIGTAIEACATKTGTFVGPLLSEMIGFDALTLYRGGWCGNELIPASFSDDVRADIHHKTEKLGNELYQRGYRGYFEVDYLIDKDDGQIYLGELNPRITGISALTNMSPFCQNTIPLFLFHLLEFSDIPLTLSPKDYNAQSLAEGATGTSSQMIFKYTAASLRKIVAAPMSGVYRLTTQDKLELVQASYQPIDSQQNPDLAYILRIMQPDDYAYEGGDLAIIFLNTAITEQQGHVLNSTAKRWISAVNNAFVMRDLSAEEQQLIARYSKPSSIKANAS
jgi:hypothetical protein